MSSPLPEIEIEFFVDDLRNALPQIEGDFHRVFHDPFAPPQAPHLWSVEIFQHYARLLEAMDGQLLTYSGAAAVRGGLQEAEFQVLKTQGVGSKIGGTVAFKGNLPTNEQATYYRPLDEWEKTYLESRAGIPYRDPTLQGTAESVSVQRVEEQNQSSRPSGSASRPKYFSKFQTNKTSD